MKTSTRGLLMLMRHEAIVLSTYEDSVGVATIGVGHTAAAGDPKPIPGMTISLAEALELFRKDIARYEAGVNRAVTVPLAPHEFDGLLSFHYNTGAIGTASLVKKLNAGDRQGAADGLRAWNKAGGKVLPGLTRRRAEERELFLTGNYGDLATVPVYDRFPGPQRRVSTAGLLDAERTPPASSLDARVAALEGRVSAIEAEITAEVPGPFGA